LTSLSRQAGNADRFTGKGIAVEQACNINENRKQGRQRKKNLWWLGLGENKGKKHQDQQRK
jgi:hypothetical protein